MERNEYLQRPLIKNVVYEVTDSKVNISSPHTVFISANRYEEIPLSEVRRLFYELKKEAKDSGKVKLNGVTKFLPTVRTLYPSYQAAVKRINTLFAEIVGMIPKLEVDGLHMGCTDDELLKEIKGKEWEISRFYHCNTDYSCYLRHYQNIKDILSNKLWKNENLIKIVIWVV